MTQTRRAYDRRIEMKRPIPALRILQRVLACLAIAHSSAYAATFDVTTTADSGKGSLRQAILDANSSGGGDLITFSIPGGGEQIIKLDTELPPILDFVIIDGYTQPGAWRNTRDRGFDAVVNIFIDGSAIPPSVTIFSETYGLTFRKGADGSVLSGVKLSGFSHGVVLANVDKVTVEGSKVLDNGVVQILVSGNDNVIGLPGAFGRNLIAGKEIGIHLAGERNTVKNNYIGFAESIGEKVSATPGVSGIVAWFGVIKVDYASAAVNGSDLVCNRVCGLAFRSNHHQIGGLEKGEGNVIVGQRFDGVVSRGSSREEKFNAVMHVDGNLFGARFDGKRDPGLRNFYGVFLNHQGPGVIGIQGNSIYDGEVGIVVSGGTNPVTGTMNPVTGARLSNNRIVGHHGLAIDLGENSRDTNDSLDKDGGDNNTQNFPVLSGVPSGNGWVLDSAASQSFTLEFFQSGVCKTPEADTFLGAFQVTTDASGHAVFTGPLNMLPGGFITATATDKAGNTSELSECVAAAKLKSKIEIVAVKTPLLSGSWDSRFEMRVDGGGVFAPTGSVDLWYLEPSGARRWLGTTGLNGGTAIWENVNLHIPGVAPLASIPGAYRIQAEYAGDSAFEPSNSNAVDFRVYDVKHTFSDAGTSDLLRADFLNNPQAPQNYEILAGYDLAAGLTGNWKPVGLAAGKRIVAAGKFIRGFGRASYLASDLAGNMTLEDRVLPNASLTVRPITGWQPGTVVEIGRFFQSHQQGIVVATGPKSFDVRLLPDVFHSPLQVVRSEVLRDETAVGSITSLSIVAVGDFDGDGNDDIIWEVNGVAKMQLMKGLTNVGLPVDLLPPVTVANGSPIFPSIFAVGDFDGDGRTDILWRAADNYYVALMNGTALKGAPGQVAVIGNGWEIKAVADYDGDGTADLLWRNNSGFQGANVIYYMNGSSLPPAGRAAGQVQPFLPLTIDFIDP
jgi:hypothetical protein